MISQLRAAHTAQFFDRTARITNKAVRELFADLLDEASNPSRPLFKIVRQQRGEVRLSALCFAYEKPVPFLSETAGRVDKIHGLLLLVEKGTTIALLKTGLDLTRAFKKAYLSPIGRGRVERAIARHDAVFEKLSLRNMTTSKLALRGKTLEARDLENAIAATSSGRFIPQSYRVRRNGGSYSATPSTGRIAMRSARADLNATVAWASQIVDLLADEVTSASVFIKRFARPAELHEIGQTTVPTFFAVDTMALADALWEADNKIRLVRQEGGVWVELDKTQIDALLADLDNPFSVIGSSHDSECELQDEAGNVVGTIRFNKSRIALRRLERASISRVYVEDASLGIGDDRNRQLLTRYLDSEDMFTVLFSDIALAYIDGSLFRDEGLVSGGTVFMRHLLAEPLLAAATSEKGAFTEGQTQFTVGSVFRVVIDAVAKEELLLCDDLGDEWADFIGVSSDASPATISFYHAKHGEPSLSASAFHDAVGQAIKNLGRLSMAGDIIEAKQRTWDGSYRNDNVTTDITRRIRGGARAEVERKIALAAAAPDVQRRVLIVTSSLSRVAVQDAFDSAAAGHPPKPSFVQLYWLLIGFFSACSEVGAIGFVVCQP